MRGVNRPVPKGYPGHPNDACPVTESLHALTTAERALIQTFPDDFYFPHSMTTSMFEIGNAVPPVLAHQVADSVAKYMNRLKKEGFDA